MLCSREKTVLDVQATKCQQRCEFIFLYCIGKQTEFQVMVLVTTSKTKKTFGKLETVPETIMKVI